MKNKPYASRSPISVISLLPLFIVPVLLILFTTLELRSNYAYGAVAGTPMRMFIEESKFNIVVE